MKHVWASGFFVLLLALLALWSLFAPISVWIFVLVALLWLATAAVGSSFMALEYHVKSFRRAKNPGSRIALTFDDGPAPETLKLLDLLKAHEVKATFFCIGAQLEKHPEIARRVHGEGHLLANHSYSHSHFFDFFGTSKVAAELRKTDALIAEITGHKPRFFRPPYGVTNPSIRRALLQTKHLVMGWNLRSMDGVRDNIGNITQRVQSRLKPGAIVLLHDNRTHSAAVLEQLLTSVRALNLEPVRLDELLELNAYEN